MKATVIGGGLAGLAAAVELADGGAQVTLHESRPRLGGATFSFERNGLWLDNGQHVALRCCTAYLAFLRADSMDLAFSAFAIAEVDDIARVFRQVQRVLKPNAPFVFSFEHPMALLRPNCGS